MAPRIVINGGSPGVKASVSAGGAVSATLESTSGVRTVAWSIIGTDETSEAADYTLATSGTVGQNVATTALTAGTAAILKVVINGGINLQTGLADTAATTATAKFYVPTAGSGEVGCVGETTESDSAYGFTGIINFGVRNVAGSAVQSIVGNAPIVVDATDPANPVVSFAPSTNVAMGGYGFTGCDSVANASGALSLDGTSVSIGGTSATIVNIGRSGQTIRLPALAGSGSGVVAVDNSGNISWSAGGSGTYIAGDGLTESPTGTFNVGATDSTVTIAANGIKVATGGITNTEVNASAAIAGSKISPDFGAQNIVTTGSGTFANTIAAKYDAAATLSIGSDTATSVRLGRSGQTVRLVPLASAGVVHVDASGDTSSSTIVNADVNSSAAIDGSKITPTFTAATSTTVTDSATGAGTLWQSLKHASSGTPTTNFDGQRQETLHNSANADKLAANWVTRWATATAGNETTQIALRLMGAGGAATSDKFLWYYDGNFFGDYIALANVVVANTTSGFRFLDSGNRGGLDRDGSDNLRIKSYNSKQFVIQTGANGSGVGGTTRQTIETDGNVAWFGAGSYGGGVLVHFIANAGTNPSTNPTGGGILYADAGAGKWRGSSGTVTTFGTAEPHCPTCGRDFAHEWQNDRTGEHLAICVPCMLNEMASAGLNTSAFAFIRKGL